MRRAGHDDRRDQERLRAHRRTTRPARLRLAARVHRRDHVPRRPRRAARVRRRPGGVRRAGHRRRCSTPARRTPAGSTCSASGGAFDADQARAVLTAGRGRRAAGRACTPTSSAPGPGVRLAVELGAASVDHCTYLDRRRRRRAGRRRHRRDAAAGRRVLHPRRRTPTPAACSTPASPSRWPPTATPAPATPARCRSASRSPSARWGMTPAEALWRRHRRRRAGARRDDVGALAPGPGPTSPSSTPRATSTSPTAPPGVPLVPPPRPLTPGSRTCSKRRESHPRTTFRAGTRRRPGRGRSSCGSGVGGWRHER